MHPDSPRVLEALLRAEKLFTQCLTAEERSRIHTVRDLSALVDQTKKFADELQSKDDQKGSFGFRKVGKKAILLEPLERLVEGAAKTSPSGGSMIWGSILFTLEMVKDNARAFDEALEFFENFTDEVRSLDLQNQTFSASPLVQSVMQHLYVAILNLWVAAVTYYRAKTGGLRQRFKTFVTSSIVQKGFDLLKAEISAQKIRLHDATTAEHNAESSTFHANSMTFQQTMRQRELKKWLNAPDYEHDLRTANDLRYEGTCDWLSRRQPYIDLGMSSSSLFLYIHGIPGSGKTVLSSWIINDLRNVPGTALLLYHYFKDTDANKRTPLSAVRSFIDQLHDYLRHTHSPLLADLELNLEKASLDRSGHVGYAHLWNVFLPSAAALASLLFQQSLSHTIIFVMDAIDECQFPSPLISDLTNLAKTHPDQICILVTGRNSALDMIQQSLPSSFSSFDELEITMDDVHSDIQAFVRHAICNVPRLRGHPMLRDRLQEEIGRASNHQGMFLWAYFMCEEVKRQGDPLALQRLLDHLPKGLDAMYVRICFAIIDQDHGIGFSLSVLRWLVSSPRPMRFAELQDGLKLMRSPAISVASDPWFDKTSDLLWSRQDIVDACGNLVIYTGLTDGDSFRLVHLSATQFFRHVSTATLPETARLFVNDVRNAEFELGALCLQYLLGEALHSHKYIALTANYNSFQQWSKLDDFLKNFPLFQFAVIYWPRFILGGLRVQGGNPVIPGFVPRIITLFNSTSTVIVWFVHAIGWLSIEEVIDMLEQLAKVGSDGSGLVTITAWARKSVDILTAYGDSLFECPELIRKCWPMDVMLGGTAPSVRTWQIAHEVTTEATARASQPLPRTRYAWIHYDPRKDLLLAIEYNMMCLRVHLMKSSVSMRPGIVPSYPGMPLFFPLRAAVVSLSSTFMAAIFDTEAHDDEAMISHPVFLICWKLPAPASDAILQAQPDLILCEKYTTAIHSGPHSDRFGLRPIPSNVQNHIAFVGDDLLVTPRGIWNLKMKEWLPSVSLYQDVKKIGYYSFSGNGERAVRVGGNEDQLWFLETQRDVCISQVKFPHTSRLFPLSFSFSGQKIVFCRNLPQPAKSAEGCPCDTYLGCCTGFGNRISCLVVDDQNVVDLHTPYNIHIDSRMQVQFSNDEETIVAIIAPCASNVSLELSPSIIGVWKLIKDAKGHHTHASFNHYYKEWNRFSSFCLVPAHHSVPEMVLVVAHGFLKQRPLSMTWTEEEEASLFDQDPNFRREIVEIDPKEKIITVKALSKECNEKTSVLLKKWSYGPLSLQIIASATWTLDASYKTITSWSSNATYLIADETLLQVFDGDTALERNEQTRVLLDTHKDPIKATAFSTDNHRIVVLHYDDRMSIATLVMSDIRDGSLSTIATCPVDIGPLNPDRELSFDLNFSPVNSSHLLLTVTTSISTEDDLMAGQGGFDVNREIHAIAFELLADQLVSTNIRLQYGEQDYESPVVQFSPCGKYYLSWDGIFQVPFPCLYPLILRHKSLSHEDIETVPHPVVMEDCQPYIYDQRTFVWDIQRPVVLLFCHLGPTENRRCLQRVICIVPKNAGEKVDNKSFLIWPEDKQGEVTIVMAGDSNPLVIETGILSGDLLEEDAWGDSAEEINGL